MRKGNWVKVTLHAAELDQIISELSDRPGNAEIVAYLTRKRACLRDPGKT